MYVSDILQMEITEENESLVYLERAVHKYSFQKMYLQKVGVTDLNIDIQSIENRLLDRIQSFLLKAVKQNDSAVLTRCLRMYVDLCLQNKAEQFYRESIVRPVIRNIFTQKNLDKNKQQLCILYQEALQFLENDMRILEEVLKKYTHR